MNCDEKWSVKILLKADKQNYIKLMEKVSRLMLWVVNIADIGDQTLPPVYMWI